MQWIEIQNGVPKDGEEVLCEVNHGDGVYHAVVRWSPKTSEGVVAWTRFEKRSSETNYLNVGKLLRQASKFPK